MDQLHMAAEKPGMYLVLLIIGALTFVVALAWNESMQSYMKKKFMKSGDEVKANFWYAVIVTVILMITAFIAAKFFKR